MKIKFLSRRNSIFLGLLLLFCLWFVSLNFILLDDAPESPHHHADFAVYIDGQRLKFESSSYYEETSKCTTEYVDDPVSRVHMHDQIDHVIHVHDYGVTYGHFFANLGFNLSDDVLQTRDQVYIDGQGGQLRFILNGKKINYVNNLLIQSEDVLLVDFSDDPLPAVQARFREIPRGAKQANTVQDPSGCSGRHEDESLFERLKRSLRL